MYTIYIHMYTIYVHMYTIYVHMYTIYIHMYAKDPTTIKRVKTKRNGDHVYASEMLPLAGLLPFSLPSFLPFPPIAAIHGISPSSNSFLIHDDLFEDPPTTTSPPWSSSCDGFFCHGFSSSLGCQDLCPICICAARHLWWPQLLAA